MSEFQSENEQKQPGHSSTTSRFEVTVTDPEKKGEGMYQYMSYKVNTILEQEGGLRQSCVVRRFSDFDWLRDQLVARYPGLLIPPLPEKAIIAGRFSVEFLNERRRGLEQFLNRLLSHYQLSSSSDLDLFLFGDDVSLAAAKNANQKATDNKQQMKQFVSFFKESFQTISTQLGATKEREKSAEDITCERINDYANQLETHLTAVHNNVQSLVAKDNALGKAWFDLGFSLTLLGQYETQSREANLGQAFSQLGNVSDKLSVLINKKAEGENAELREPLKEYIGLADSVKSMMKCRATALSHYQAAQSTLESRRSKLTAVTGQPGKEDKVLQAEKLVQQAEMDMEVKRQELESTSRKALEEFERFKQTKEQDLKHMMLRFVRLQIEYNKKIEQAWESVLPDIENLP